MDIHQIACRPEGMLLIADALLPNIPDGVAAIGGPMGESNAIVMATSAIAATRGRMFKTFLVERDTENQARIWGLLTAGEEVALIDGSVFTGSSLMWAAESVKKAGAVPACLLALFDGVGTMEESAAQAGLNYSYLFGRRDLGLP